MLKKNIKFESIFVPELINLDKENDTEQQWSWCSVQVKATYGNISVIACLLCTPDGNNTSITKFPKKAYKKIKLEAVEKLEAKLKEEK